MRQLKIRLTLNLYDDGSTEITADTISPVSTGVFNILALGMLSIAEKNINGQFQTLDKLPEESCPPKT